MHRVSTALNPQWSAAQWSAAQWSAVSGLSEAETHTDCVNNSVQLIVWLDRTAQLLQARRFTEIDVDNLIEEIESLSRSDKRELRRRLIVLLSHLLKDRYQPENRSQSWLSTIAEQRRQIELILEDSSSLKNYLAEVFAACYSKARVEAAQETQLDIVLFPENYPFAQGEILDSNWLPQ